MLIGQAEQKCLGLCNWTNPPLYTPAPGALCRYTCRRGTAYLQAPRHQPTSHPLCLTSRARHPKSGAAGWAEGLRYPGSTCLSIPGATSATRTLDTLSRKLTCRGKLVKCCEINYHIITIAVCTYYVPVLRTYQCMHAHIPLHVGRLLTLEAPIGVIGYNRKAFFCNPVASTKYVNGTHGEAFTRNTMYWSPFMACRFVEKRRGAVGHTPASLPLAHLKGQAMAS